MAKYNPASKASRNSKEADEEDSDEPTTSADVEEMLDQYREYKEQTESSATKSEAVDRLPERAFMERGKLWVPDEEDGRDTTKAGLTEQRKEILRVQAEHPSKSQTELSRMVSVSQSYFSKAIRLFGFLIEDPLLYEAFVLDGRVSGDSWTVRNGDVESSVASKAQGKEILKQKWSEQGEFWELISPEGDVITVGDLLNQEAPLRGPAESDSDSESSVPVTWSDEEVARIVGSLYAQDEAELATEFVSRCRQ